MAVVTAEAEGVAVPTEGAVDGVEEAKVMEMEEVEMAAVALAMAAAEMAAVAPAMAAAGMAEAA